jgi:protein SCO1/2
MKKWAFLAVLVLAAPAAGDDRLPPVLSEVGFDQRLGAQVPLDAVFRDEAGREVRLGECIAGKPTILVLAWLRCPMLCTHVLNSLVTAMRGLEFTAGREFNVVTVSFDAREQPDLAAAKKASYVEEYGRPGAEDGWHFLTGEQVPIGRLTGAVGFRCRWDPATQQFAHASGIMILTPEGRIARYFFGLDYKPRDLRLGLVEASDNRIGSKVDQVMLWCYKYDPNTGKYTAAVMNVVRLGGALTALLLGAYLGRTWWRERKGRAAAPAAG